MTWTSTRLKDWTVHTVPDVDTVQHTFTPGCICGPTPERVTAQDGGDNWLYVHHSLDGREAGERKAG